MKKPTVIQFPVNNICNSRCQMCDIWRQQKAHEISPLELRKVLSDPVFSEVRAVGMNGGEPTLRQDLAALARELCNGLPQLRSISLITNGLRPHLVIPRVTELCAVTKAANVKLDIMLSLDGVGDVHDRVRGRQGNFLAVEECLNYFRDNRIGDSHRLGCTLISENIEDAERLMLWAENQDIYCRFRVGIPHQRLYTKDKQEPFSLSDKKLFHLCNFLDILSTRYEANDLNRRLFLKNLRDQIIYNRPRLNGCAWKDEGVTLLSDGSFAYCAVESPSLGNPLMGDNSYSSLYFDNKVVRDSIRREKCDGCLHDYEGKSTALKERLLIRLDRYAQKYNIPTKPVKALNFSIDQIRNSFKLLPHAMGNSQRGFLSNQNQKKILIVGWYGTETLGDKAILYSIIEQLLLAGIDTKQIEVASIEPYITEYTLKEYDRVSGCSVLSLKDAEIKADRGEFSQVIFGGGPIMSSISYLCNIAKIFNSIKIFGGRAIIWGCGMGPIRNSKRDFINKIAISQILRLSDICIFRDQKSLEIAKQFVGKNILNYSKVALDPAFHWVKSQRKSSKSSMGTGFAIRNLPIKEYYNDFYGNKNELIKDFNYTMISLMQKHAETGPVYLQCMHRLPCGGDDRLFYSDLLGEKINSYKFSLEHKNPLDDISCISELKSIYAMRFHSVVFAISLNIPVIPIDYTNGGKISSFCELLGIRCWTPEQLSNLYLKQNKLPKPQKVNTELLETIASRSTSTYYDLAKNIYCFAKK